MKRFLIPFLAFALCSPALGHENQYQLVLVNIHWSAGGETFTTTTFPVPTKEGCMAAGKDWKKAYKSAGWSCVPLK